MTGLKARGGYEVELEWKDAKLIDAKLRSLIGGNCTVCYGPEVLRLATRSGRSYELGQRLLPRGVSLN